MSSPADEHPAADNSRMIDNPIPIGPAGGLGGSTWSCFFKDGLKQIVIIRGRAIDSLTFKSTDNSYSRKFGGNGGSMTDTVDFDWPHEYLVSVSGTYGSYNIGRPVVILSLLFVTNRTKYGPFGSNEGTHFSFSMEGGVIVGFHGKEGRLIDSIGVYVKPIAAVFPIIEPPQTSVTSDANKKEVVSVTPIVQSFVPRGPGPWGGPGGKQWDDGVFSGIKQIHVQRGKYVIHSIQVEYVRKNGESVWSQIHGSSTDDIIKNRIKLDYPNESLNAIAGFYAPVDGNRGLNAITSLCFYTNKGKYGPLGDEVGTYFSSSEAQGEVVGLHGRSGVYLDAIGVHMEYA